MALFEGPMFSKTRAPLSPALTLVRRASRHSIREQLFLHWASEPLSRGLLHRLIAVLTASGQASGGLLPVGGRLQPGTSPEQEDEIGTAQLKSA